MYERISGLFVLAMCTAIAQSQSNRHHAQPSLPETSWRPLLLDVNNPVITHVFCTNLNRSSYHTLAQF